MLRYLIPLGIFAVISLFLYIGLGLNPRDIGVTTVGKPLPAFTLTHVLDTEKTLTDKDLLGKVALLNAWASWCVTCRHEHPLLMQLAAETAIPIYGLNYQDDLAEAQTLLKETGNPYIASGFDEHGQVGIALGLTGTPETFIVDKQGIIRYKQTGPLTVKVLSEEILPLLQRLNDS